MTREQIIARLEQITSKPGFAFVLAILVRSELFVDPAEFVDKNLLDFLNIQELTFLCGLMVKHKLILDLPIEEKAAEDITEIKKLFSELHVTYSAPLIAELQDAFLRSGGPNIEAESEQKIDRLFASGEAMAEPILYGGSGAYDFQFIALARARYARDADWLRANRGFTLEDVWRFPALLKQKAECLPQSVPSNFAEFCRDSLATFTFSSADLRAPCDVASKFLHAFSLETGRVNANFVTVGQYNAVASHPIIRLDKDSFFLPIHYLLSQSLYESPFYWMFRDKEYQATAARNRGATTEQMAYDMLRQVFGAGTLKNITVKKGKSETVTDIDLLVVVGNKAIVFQAKSKRLTELSRQGDTEALKKDFASAVQDAYNQGLACRDAILARQSTLLDSSETVVTLSESIDDVYVICLTSDDYPAVTIQVDTYLDRPTNAPAPVAISIFDLEIILFYLSDPFSFLYYVRQRIALSDYFSAPSEMAFLGYHLRKKLFRMKGYDHVNLDEQFAQLIDASYPALMGNRPITEATERLRPIWKNEKFDRLVREIQRAGEPGFTDAIFYLYDLSSTSADDLIHRIETAVKNSQRTGRNSDFSMIFDNGNSGISFIYFTGERKFFCDAVTIFAKARKYKTKADTWLALGAFVGSHRSVDMVAFSKARWCYDLELEKLVRLALKQGTALGPNGKRVGRNDPCICSSGKKFKKCCGRT